MKKNSFSKIRHGIEIDSDNCFPLRFARVLLISLLKQNTFNAQVKRAV